MPHGVGFRQKITPPSYLSDQIKGDGFRCYTYSLNGPTYGPDDLVVDDEFFIGDREG